MPGEKNSKRKEAFNLFRLNKGKITNRAIAEKLDVPAATVGSWKSRDRWIERTGGEFKARSETQIQNAERRDRRKKNREKVENALYEINMYNPALDLLIDLYLDCREEYEEAQANGANTEKIRKELSRLIGQLGLDGKNKDIPKVAGTLLAEPEKQNNEEQEKPASKLLQFRKKVGQ